MPNNETLMLLCQRLVDNQFDTIHDAEQALEQFELLTTPGAVLGLINDLDEARNGMAYTPIMRLKGNLDRLELENKALREALTVQLIDATTLTGIVINTDSLTLAANGGICRIMADAFGQMLFEGKVENYIEAYFSSSKYPEMGQIVVTVKKEMGMTPHQLRLTAELERDELRQDKARLDWFDRMNLALNQHYGTAYRWRVVVNHNINRLVLRDLKTVDMSDTDPFGLPSCREAIDAAMAEGQQS
jgi:hypothetical protein